MTATIYTTNTCAYCPMVKKYLDKKNIEYDVINLDNNPEVRQDLYERTGAMTVPITRINDQWVIGWNPGQLAQAIA